MPIQLLLPFCPVKAPCDAQYAISLSAMAGLYALGGVVLGMASPLAAAVYGVVSSLSTRAIHYGLDKWGHPSSIVQKVIHFAVAFFVGSLISAFLTNAVGLSMSFAVGILLHGVVLATVLTVICVALPCVFCAGAAIGVKLLPE